MERETSVPKLQAEVKRLKEELAIKESSSKRLFNDTVRVLKEQRNDLADKVVILSVQISLLQEENKDLTKINEELRNRIVSE